MSEQTLITNISVNEAKLLELEQRIQTLTEARNNEPKKGKKGHITRAINKLLAEQTSIREQLAKDKTELSYQQNLKKVVQDFNETAQKLDTKLQSINVEEYTPKTTSTDTPTLHAFKTSDGIIRYYVDMGFNFDEAVMLTDNYLLSDFTLNPAEFLEQQQQVNHTVEPEQFFDDIRKEGVFEIGADFKGVLEIEECNTEMVYVPSSYYCALKCYEQYFKDDPRWQSKENNRHGMCSYKNTPNELKAYMNKLGFEIDKLPRMVRYDGKKKKFVALDSHHKTSATATIVLVKLKGNSYHAVLLRTDQYNYYSNDYYRTLIKFIKNLTLSDEQIYIRNYIPKLAENKIFVYDIETITEHGEVTNKDGITQLVRYLIPYAVAYKLVDLNGETDNSNVHMFQGRNCLTEMTDHLFTFYDFEHSIIFAHNGGAFDHLLMKTVNALHFTSQVKSGNGIKCLDAEYLPLIDGVRVRQKKKEDKQTIRFLDSLAFTQMSLDASCKALKCSNKKMEFDIVDRTAEFFDTTNEWKRYLELDVLCLAELLQKFEQSLKKFGESVSVNCGIASLAWRIMLKSCTHMGNQYRAKNPVTLRFIRSSCYGGRVLHWKKEYHASRSCTRTALPIQNGKCGKCEPSDSDCPMQWTDGLISLDGTSLYPSAMCLGRYPIGKFTIMEEPTIEYIHSLLDQNVCFIVELDLDAGNVRYPIVPYKTYNGTLVYPAGKFTGVYNSVDLSEARSMGYELSNVKRGIYWTRSADIFSGLINCMFNERKKYKAENNPLEYTIKILLNAMYGKYLEIIRSGYKFESIDKQTEVDSPIETDKESVDLTNGQFQRQVKYDHAIENKPAQIGSFILSYARAIVNKLIHKVGPENVYYGDTDSIYVPHSIIAEKEIILKDELGEFKNDYGNGKLIVNAIFLDIKRYYLELNDGTFKCKFNGYNFRQKCAIGSHLEGVEKKQKIRELYEYFRDNPNTTQNEQMCAEKWLRTETTVTIAKKELKFQVNPKLRAQWVLSCEHAALKDVSSCDCPMQWTFYPLGYDHSKPEKEREYARNIIDTCKSLPPSDQYVISRKGGLKSALPILSDKTIKVPVSKLPNKDFRFSFVEAGGKVYQKITRTKTNESGQPETEIHYYDICDYGPVREIHEDDWKKAIEAREECGIVTLTKPDRLTPSSYLDQSHTAELINKIKQTF